MSYLDELRGSVESLKAAYELRREELLAENDDQYYRDPTYWQDTNGRSILLDALTALVNAQTAIVNATRQS